MAQNLVEYILDIKTKAAEQGLDKVVDALEDVEKELKKTKKESEKASSSLEQFKKAGMQIGKVVAVMSAVAVAIGAAGKVAFDASKKVTDLVNELNDLSVRSGVSAKTIQGLRQAMISSGQSAEGLTEVLGAISGQFAQLSTEGSAVEKKFLSFGVAVRDTNGDLRSNNDILLDGIRLLQGITDSSDRSRAAVTLFGEAGAKLNQALASGDFEKFLSFTEKFGIDAGPQASKTAAQFQVVLSALGTVLDGTLQKFVKATDGQNRFIKGMIELGGVIAFTGSLIESFADTIDSVTDGLIALLKFGIKQTIVVLTGPFALAIGSIINNLELFGIQVDFVNKAMSSLANFTIQTIDPTNRLSGAIDKAKADMNEYKSTLGDLNINLDGFSSGSSNASVEVDNLAKSTKNATEEIRTLQDVVNDLLGRFVSFDINKYINKFISDFSLGFDFLSEKIDKVFDVSKIDRWTNNLRSSLLDATTLASTSDPLKIPEMVIESTKMSGLKKLLTKIKVGFGEGASIAAKGLSRIGGKIGGALSKGLSAGASLAITGVLAVLKIAEGLGQRGSTVGEIEKSVEEDIRARAKAIELGLQALPRILFKVLPKVFIELVDRIIFGFQKAFAEFINIAFERFKSLYTREGRQERRQERRQGRDARGEEFRSRLEQLVNIAGFRSGGKYIPSARGGIKFTGADEGLAMLHRGEFVVPETGQMPQAVQRTMGMGGSGINITINASVVESNAVDELVRQIERRFQTFGSSTSPLFGGR
jgi:hypothetical protein